MSGGSWRDRPSWERDDGGDPVEPEEDAETIRDDMLAPPPARDPRIDFERRMRVFPPLTIAIILLCVAVFAWEAAIGALKDEGSIVAAGALHRDRVKAGEVWRLGSAMFLHGGPDHLLGNCFVLYIVGMACEHAFGAGRLLLVYLASGLAGSLLSVAAQPGPSVGASGAIFGVTGCVIVFFYRYQQQVRLRDKRIGFVLLVWAVYQIGSGALTPFIDNFAHLGGLLGGAVTALILRPVLLDAAPGEHNTFLRE